MIKSLERTGTYRTYTMADGLTGMRIEHIAEDSEGYLWFATWDNGVSRFDGDEFQNFTQQDGLVSDRVYFILQDSQKRLWFGTLNGVCWYDGADFHHLEDEGIVGRAVQFIYEDRESRIWFGGHRTLGYYDDTAFHDLIPLYLQDYEQPPSSQWPNQCRGIAQDPQGQMWFGFNYLIRFDGTSFHRVAPDARTEAFTDVINRRGSQQFIGHSAALREFQFNLEKIASTNITVLIMGETGVGKGLAARILHALSAHSDGPFIEVSCGALPGALIDSELFGQERGAFTSAVSQRLGRVELAEGGTLFLEEW